MSDKRRLQSEETTVAPGETLYNSLLSSVGDGVWVASTDGSAMQYVNPAVERIYGRPATEFYSDTNLWLDVVHPDDMERAKQTVRNLFEHGAAEDEYRIVRPDGEVRWLLDRKSVVVDKDGKPVGIGGIATDITERRQAERSLRESESRLQLALKALNGGVWEWNVQTGKGYFTPSWYRMLGYEPNEFEGNARNWKSVLHPDDKPSIMKALKEHYERRSPYYSEHRMRKKNGEWIWVLDRGQVVERDEDDKALLMTGTNVDISVLKRAEETVAASEAKFQDLFDNAPDMFASIDAATGRIVECNRTVLQALGYTKDELIGTDLLDLYHSDYREEARQAFQHFVANGEVQVEHLQLKRKDGSKIDVSLKVSAYRDDHGRILFSRSVWRDITELKKLERERKQLETQVQHAQKLESLGVLAGGIAHDFNNILTGILGNAELTAQTLEPSAAAHQYLKQVEESSIRAADLCQQLLAYSGKGRFVVKALDLSELVQDMTRLLNVSISKKATLRFDLVQDLPAIEADVNQIRQVVMNLITNASEAIDGANGAISIRTCMAQVSPDHSITRLGGSSDGGPYVCLEVSDTGCGMEDETTARIFDPFFTTKFTGRGLGLAAVLGIVRAHEGAIELSSRPGQGTTFKVLFPPSEKLQESIIATEKSAGKWRGEGTILVVDDEDGVRALAEAILKRRGFEVVTACNGYEAVEIFRERHHEIDAVLLDLTMPKMNGLECLAELRVWNPDVKVLLTSGYNEQDVVDQFDTPGVAGFVQKPYRQTDFIAKFRELLRPEADTTS